MALSANPGADGICETIGSSRFRAWASGWLFKLLGLDLIRPPTHKMQISSLYSLSFKQ